MSTTYGLSATGFVKKTLAQIESELKDSFVLTFGQYINTLPQSIMGQIIGILAEREALLWDQAQDLYAAMYPDTASGQSLDNVVAFNNIVRLPATPTKVSGVLLTGTPGGSLAAGKQASVQVTGFIFSLDQDVTFDGSGNATGNFTCKTNGPIPCPAGQMTIIQTPSTGWLTVTNPTDGVPGTNIETDDALRLRRLNSLENSVSGPVAAIATAVGAVSGVSQVVPFENFTNVIDSNGLPPHSFEIYVFGGSDSDIEKAIYASKPAGIQPYGTTCGPVLDTIGQPHTICFARLIQRNVYGQVNVHVNSRFPSNGDVLIKQALVSYINTLIGGQELVVTPQLISQLSGITGIESAVILISLNPSPTTSANIQPNLNEILRSDTSLWSVTHV
jgi:uncharacterized phage protein gp47/JayE